MALTRKGLRVRSGPSANSPTGLGYLPEGVVYFFRVAAENENGVGPFSDKVLAVTARVFTGEDPCHKIMARNLTLTMFILGINIYKKHALALAAILALTP